MEARCRRGVNRPGGATARDTARVKPCSLWKPEERKPPGTVSVTPNRRSACEWHDPTGEPDAGNPHVRFGGQGVGNGPMGAGD